MPIRLSRLLAIAVMLGASQFAIAGSRPFSGDAACDVLIAVAKGRHFVGNIAGTFYCESIDDFLGGKYYLMNLKFNREDAEREFVGSNLVGWYAVQKSNWVVFEVDIGEGRLGKRVPSLVKPPKPNHTFQPMPSARLN
jgi:hypothetical protein